MLVDGSAAAGLSDLFRQRWARASGSEQIPVAPTSVGDAWPSAVRAHLFDSEVAIARTEPAYEGRPLVDEIRRLALASIAAAAETIYLENQYFTSTRIAAALAARLSEPNGPEIVLILSPRSQAGSTALPWTRPVRR